MRLKIEPLFLSYQEPQKARYFVHMIEQYLSSQWALEPRFHNVQASLLLRKMSMGVSLSEMQAAWDAEREKHSPYLAQPQAAHVDRNGQYHRWDKVDAKNGQVAIIPIIGSMTRYGGMCSYGAEDYASWIIEANQMPWISAIVLEINSPGGQVDGTQLLGEVVKQSKKPVVAYVAGMAASAAYWVASQADEIIMESRTTSDVGSIGVLAMHVDASAMYEKEGYKIKILRSEGSEDKALFNGVEPLSEDIESSVRKELSLIRNEFVKTVKAGRPQIADDVFSGKMYPGGLAIKKGMADGIGYLGAAVKRADEFAKSK